MTRPVVGVIGNAHLLDKRFAVQLVGERNLRAVAEVAGALPLMFAHGAGSASRGAIGVVVVFGVLLSTLLSLFVIPAFYLLLARFSQSPEARTHMLESLDAEVASVDRSHGG